MAIYVDANRPARYCPPVKTFYVDDSNCEIFGVQHALLGAISFWDESPAIFDMLQLKRAIGLRPDREIKWNSQSFSDTERRALTEGMLSILTHCRGFLVVTDRSKQTAALELAVQLSDFCASAGLGGFVCRFDKNIIAGAQQFSEAASGLNPPCAGWSEGESAHDQLIQCADMFVGFQKLRIDLGLGRKKEDKLIEVEAYEGLRSEYPLGWYLRLALRHSLWGRVQDMNRSGQVWKENIGFGVRMVSSLPDALQDQALSHLGRENLGCIH